MANTDGRCNFVSLITDMHRARKYLLEAVRYSGAHSIASDILLGIRVPLQYAAHTLKTVCRLCVTTCCMKAGVIYSD